MKKESKSKSYYHSLNWDFSVVYNDENKNYDFTLKDNDLKFSGQNPSELLQKFPDELDKWLDSKSGKEHEIQEPLNIVDCNGRLNLRVSETLHYKLVKEASMEGLTINHLVNNILNNHYGVWAKHTKVKKHYDPNNTLAIVNCTNTLNEINLNKIYVCRTTGIANSFKQFKYFGAYNKKNVPTIFEVEAVVDIEKTTDINKAKGTIYWKNSEVENTDLVNEAILRFKKSEFYDGEGRKVVRIKDIQNEHARVFLLNKENCESTNFVKDTHGGLYGVKKYFNDIAIGCNDVKELAKKLENNCWSDFEEVVKDTD